MSRVDTDSIDDGIRSGDLPPVGKEIWAMEVMAHDSLSKRTASAILGCLSTPPPGSGNLIDYVLFLAACFPASSSGW